MKVELKNVEVNEVTKAEGTSSKTGKPYVMYFIYIKGEDGIIYKMLSNEICNKKAEKGKKVDLIYIIDYNGRFILNDVKEIK